VKIDRKLKIFIFLVLCASACNYPLDETDDYRERYYTWVKTIYYNAEADSTIIIEPADWRETYHFNISRNISFVRFYKGDELLLETKYEDTHFRYRPFAICDEVEFCYAFEDDFNICTAEGDSNGIRILGLPWIEDKFNDECKTYSYFRVEVN
jgi:hypothetical protein